MVDSAGLHSDLCDIVGEPNVLTGDDIASLLVDFRDVFHGEALAVVRPGSTSEVAAVIACCGAAGVAVVTQGGNTGLSGGAIPQTGVPSVIVSLTRMNAIESVDPDRFSLTTQAGATIEAVQEAAAAVDRLFAPDWGARGTATIGGGIATNAGGINVLRHGSMREHVLGIEVVLADGTVWNGLRALRKDSSGYDMKQLFIGSEGTLGIVTRAVVKLLPATPDQHTSFAALSSLEKLTEVLALGRSHAQDAMTAFELLPEIGIAKVCAAVPTIQRPLPAMADWYVLVRFSGTDGTEERLTEFLDAAVDAGAITDAVVAATAEQEENLWMLRDGLASATLFEFQKVGIKLDVAVPVDLIDSYHQQVVAVVAAMAPDARINTFGHAGDGNLHVHIFPTSAEHLDSFGTVRADLEGALDEITWACGGTISAEHGIGSELVGRIVGQKEPIEFDLMRRVKAALDPSGVLNPGKVLPPG